MMKIDFNKYRDDLREGLRLMDELDEVLPLIDSEVYNPLLIIYAQKVYQRICIISDTLINHEHYVAERVYGDFAHQQMKDLIAFSKKSFNGYKERLTKEYSFLN